MDILYLDRNTGKIKKEEVFGQKALKLLYGESLAGKLIGRPLACLASRFPLFSSLYGWWQKTPFTRRKIEPFIRNFEVDPSEFIKDPADYTSFNDFFVRKLKPEARPINPSPEAAVIPADGRWRFFPHINSSEGFVVKGRTFDLTSLLQDRDLASRYAEGAMVMGRLNPADCHRFLFPVDGIPGETRVINGSLYSVNPIALRKRIEIFTENKRTLCLLNTEQFGDVIFMEVGATNVGSIHQTYKPHVKVRKGEEKGYFSFGGSAIIMLFLPGAIKIDRDLLEASEQMLEVKCLMGERFCEAIPTAD